MRQSNLTGARLHAKPHFLFASDNSSEVFNRCRYHRVARFVVACDALVTATGGFDGEWYLLGAVVLGAYTDGKRRHYNYAGSGFSEKGSEGCCESSNYEFLLQGKRLTNHTGNEGGCALGNSRSRSMHRKSRARPKYSMTWVGKVPLDLNYATRARDVLLLEFAASEIATCLGLIENDIDAIRTQTVRLLQTELFGDLE